MLHTCHLLDSQVKCQSQGIFQGLGKLESVLFFTGQNIHLNNMLPEVLILRTDDIYNEADDVYCPTLVCHTLNMECHQLPSLQAQPQLPLFKTKVQL